MYKRQVMVTSPPSLRVQPTRSTAAGPGLNSSIHSSLALARVPPQAISLMTTVKGVAGVGVDVLSLIHISEPTRPY